VTKYKQKHLEGIMLTFTKEHKKLWTALGTSLLLFLLLVVILCVSSCGKKKDTKNKTASTTSAGTTAAETTTEPEETIPDGYVKSGITGTYIPEELAKSRPVAVIFNNTQAAIPQSGISQADVIYEAPMEGGDVRLLGIFQDYSNLEKIGSVRSARTYFIAFMLEYDAIFAHYGKAWTCEYLLNESFVDHLDGTTGEGSTVYYRTSDRKAPHNAYTSTEGILAGIEKKGYSTTHDADYTDDHFQFADEKNPTLLSDGIDAVYVKPGYAINKSWFEYDAETGLYNRFQFGGPQVDEMNGTQLTCKNLIIQYVPYTIYEGSSYLNLNVWDGGSGKYITNGKAIDITWKKDSQYGVTRYYDASGNEIQLNPGKTWISVCQTSRSDQTVISGQIPES
jgi:hypothetical protein